MIACNWNFACMQLARAAARTAAPRTARGDAAAAMPPARRVRAKHRVAGPEDNRVFGITDPHTARRLQVMRERVLAEQERAAAIQFDRAFQYYRAGVEAAYNTAEHAEMLERPLADMKLWSGGTTAEEREYLTPQQVRDMIRMRLEAPLVIAFENWPMNVVGRLVKAAHSLNYIAQDVFVGDCGGVVDMDGVRSRPDTSMHLARQCLRRAFPARSKRGKYADNFKARRVLCEELNRVDNPRFTLVVDGRDLPLTHVDWEECITVSRECNCVVLVNVCSATERPVHRYTRLVRR